MTYYELGNPLTFRNVMSIMFCTWVTSTLVLVSLLSQEAKKRRSQLRSQTKPNDNK